MTGTILALDVGDKRIGVAKSALDVKIPSPVGVLENTATIYQQIRDLIAEFQAKGIVVGLPMDMEYKRTGQTDMVESFSNILKSRVKIPVYFQDETLTSIKAEKELMTKGKNFQKGDIDSLAATYILEDFIEQNPDILKELIDG